MKISLEQLQETLYKLFLKNKFSEEKSHFLAKVHAETTLDSVNSHGINRVPRFINYVKKGFVKVDEEAIQISSFGMLEQWDGKLGPGIINASKSMDRAIALAKVSGIGCVALRNNNHWMRGGTYGWQAAEAGCIAICFTNTQPNMPPWGGRESRLGNNPFIIAIPRREGHIVLDMALSQFSFGKINSYKLQGKKLPFPGGWDARDELTKDPEKITENMRGLPIGYWKGSAFSMVIDMLATLLSAGDSTSKIGERTEEYGISQVFICIDPDRFGNGEMHGKMLQEIIDYSHDVAPMKPGDKTYYPGERTLQTRKHNLIHGIPVDDYVWEEVLKLLDE